MKWSYTNGKLNVSSEETNQLLQELIEEFQGTKLIKKESFSFS